MDLELGAKVVAMPRKSSQVAIRHTHDEVVVLGALAASPMGVLVDHVVSVESPVCSGTVAMVESLSARDSQYRQYSG